MGDQRTGPIPPIGDVPEPQTPCRPQHPLANYQFSSDELRVLRQCNTESFFQRSLPIGASLGLAAYFGVKRGLLSPNAKYGAAPKVVVSVIVGYFLGKFSYQQKCAEKIMQLPNSKLADLLRQRKRGGVYESFSPDQRLGAGFGLSPFQSTEVYSDEHMKYKQESSLDLDMERPSPSGLDDSFRLTLDSPAANLDSNLPTEPVKPTVSYEELRKRNREEYSKRSSSAFSRPLPSDAPSVTRSNAASASSEEPLDIERPKKKNQYGDIWT